MWILLTAASAFLVMLWARYKKMALRLGEGQELTVLLRVTGSAPELEETVRAIERLRENGELPAAILIVDAGMDSETRQAARLLARRKLVDFM